MNLGTMIVTLGVNTAQLDAASTRMMAFGKMTQRVGRSMTMYLSIPMALVGGAAIKMYKDFEFSMTKIIGLVGVARDQVNVWSKSILKLAPLIGKAPKELADAMFFITSAGIRGAKAMNVLEMSAKASAAGLGETQIVADLVTSAMNAYGSAVLGASKATDILVATVREGKAPADELASTMGMVLPIASNMGVTFDQVGAAVAGMTRTGTKAATASMQLRQILASLLKPTKQAEDILAEMGTTSAKVEKGFKAMGTSASHFRKVIREQGLMTALLELKELTEAYGETAMSKVFPNIRALAGVLDLVGANVEDNIKIFESLKNSLGAGKKAWEEASKTIEQRWNVAVSSVTTGLTVLGKTLAGTIIPIIEKIGDKIGNLTRWFKGLDDSQRQLVIRIGAIAIAAGPLLLVFGLLTTAVGSAGKAIAGLTKIMLANPYIALGAGIAALVIVFGKWMKKTAAARTEQDKLNESLWYTIEGVNDLILAYGGIEDSMSVITTMNRRQVETLVNNIKARLEAEEDFTVKIAGENKKRVEGESWTAEQWVKIHEDRAKLNKSIATGIWQTEEELRQKGLKAELQAHSERLTNLEGFLKVAKKILAGMKEPEVGGGGGIVSMSEIVAALAVELDNIIMKQTLLGTLFDSNQARINAYATALDAMITSGEGVSKVALEIADSIKILSGTLDKSIDIGDAYGEVLNEMTQSLAKFEVQQKAAGQGAKDMSDEIVDATGMVKGAIIDMAIAFGEGIGRTIAGAEGMLQGLLGVVLEFAKAFGKLLIAIGVGALSLKLIMKKGGPWAAIIAGIALVALASYGMAKVKQMNPVGKGMKEGGVIPPGYPNDSFPAMLTSGEAVIPLNRMPSVIRVVGVIKGEDIYYVNEEVARRHANNF